MILEKAEEPKIKLPTSAGSLKKQESSRKISVSALLTMPKATHSSTLAWKIPWTEEPGGLQSMGSLRVGSLEGLILKLKLQYFGHLMRSPDSFEKTLILEKIEGRRRRGQQRMRWLDSITDLMDMGLGGWNYGFLQVYGR